MSVDELVEDHALWGYDAEKKRAWASQGVEAGGRTCTLRLPEWHGPMARVVRADVSADGEFLYVFGETGRGADGAEPDGLLVVARRGVDGEYWTGVLHDLHPLRKLDLFTPAAAPPA